MRADPRAVLLVASLAALVSAGACVKHLEADDHPGQDANGASSTGETDAGSTAPKIGGTLSVSHGPSAEGGAPARPLLPPAGVGAAVSRFEGCLASATPSASDGASYPAPPQGATRGAPSTPLTVVPTGGGIVVEHPLTHACCLKGRVDTSTHGDLVVLSEVLEGDPCRCLCASTIHAAVGLKPGDYTVRVEVVEGGSSRALGERRVTVK